MFKPKRKIYLSLETRYSQLRKRFYILLSIFLIILTGMSYYVYLSFDYLVFKHLITEHYIFTDALDLMYEKELKRDVEGQYYAYFDNVVMAVVTRELRSYNEDRYTYPYLPEQYKRSKELDKEEADQSELTPLTDDVIYMRLGNFSKYTQQFIKDHLSTLQQYENIIIDLRDNPGGDIFAQYHMSDLFLPKGMVISQDMTRFKLFTRTEKSKGKQVLPYRQIVILQNKNSASSSESFIASLRDNLDNVTLIGETTFGKGIGQVTLPLRRGYAIKATTLLWNTPTNVNIHHQGIAPDILYTEPDMIDFALQYIQSK